MKKTIIIVAIALAIIAGAIYLIINNSGSGGLGEKKQNQEQEQTENKEAALTAGGEEAGPEEGLKETPALSQFTETYVNETYGFSFKYPKDLAISELPSDSGDVILVQNAAKNIGAQIIISPYPSGDIDLTAEFIKSELPDLKISQEEKAPLAAGRQALAFLSDNPAFNGQSREIWFVINENLYQLTTYADQAGFLNELFKTWESGK